MNKDILYNILLQLSPEELKSMCMTNNITILICNNPHFWKDKLINDDIPMISKVMNINDYIYHYQLKNKAVEHIKSSSTFNAPASIIPTKILNKITTYEPKYQFTIRYLMNRYVINTKGEGAVLSYHELLHFLMLYYQYKDEHPDEFILPKFDHSSDISFDDSSDISYEDEL